MTREEAIVFLKNMVGEESGRAIGKEGFFLELCQYHIQALSIAIACIQHELDVERRLKEGESE